MSKKNQEHPYIPALNGEVLRTKHDKFFIKHCLGGCHAYWLELFK
jgi:hypothetical protein